MPEFASVDIITYINENKTLKSNYLNENKPSIEIISKIISFMPKGKLIIISESWCKDCKRDVPKLAKISEILKDWEVEVVDRSQKGVKEHFEIFKIPTTIIYNEENIEIGRIIEHKKSNSLEEDILQIIRND